MLKPINQRNHCNKMENNMVFTQKPGKSCQPFCSCNYAYIKQPIRLNEIAEKLEYISTENHTVHSLCVDGNVRMLIKEYTK